MIQSRKTVQMMVGQGSPAVRRMSRRSRGVVINLLILESLSLRPGLLYSPINIANIKDLAIDASNVSLTPRPFDVNRCPPEVGTKGKVCYACSHVDASALVSLHFIVVVPTRLTQ